VSDDQSERLKAVRAQARQVRDILIGCIKATGRTPHGQVPTLTQLAELRIDPNELPRESSQFFRTLYALREIAATDCIEGVYLCADGKCGRCLARKTLNTMAKEIEERLPYPG
jgi:hypothetical protein